MHENRQKVFLVHCPSECKNVVNALDNGKKDPCTIFHEILTDTKKNDVATSESIGNKVFLFVGII